MNVSITGRSMAVSVLDQGKLVRQYRNARERFFMFDYNGSLTPIGKGTQTAILPDHVLHSIQSLAADPRNMFWIISGRSQAFIDERTSHIPELGLGTRRTGSTLCQGCSGVIQYFFWGISCSRRKVVSNTAIPPIFDTCRNYSYFLTLNSISLYQVTYVQPWIRLRDVNCRQKDPKAHCPAGV